MGEAEYMVRTRGYLHGVEDFRKVVIASRGGVPVMLSDVARVQLGPEIRRGVAELNGEGEVTGGIVIMRYGKNALETLRAVKARLAQLQKTLPAGVEIVPVYDRSGLIEHAIDTLTHKLIEEFIVVALVCTLFLFHFRSALVAIISLPLGILGAFIVMHYQGINANIMSLGGIAIAIGAMVDAAIVMIENMHKVLEQWRHDNPSARALRRGLLAYHPEGGDRSRAGAVLQSADYHPVVYSGLFAGGAGGRCSRRWRLPKHGLWRWQPGSVSLWCRC